MVVRPVTRDSDRSPGRQGPRVASTCRRGVIDAAGFRGRLTLAAKDLDFPDGRATAMAVVGPSAEQWTSGRQALSRLETGTWPRNLRGRQGRTPAIKKHAGMAELADALG